MNVLHYCFSCEFTEYYILSKSITSAVWTNTSTEGCLFRDEQIKFKRTQIFSSRLGHQNFQGWWRMKDDDFKLLRGFADWRTDRRTKDNRTDICDCRVAFATEKMKDGDEYGEEGSDEGGGKGDDESGDT